MPGKKYLLILTTLLLCFGFSALPASAGWFVDLYAGATHTADNDATATVNGVRVAETVNYGLSPTGGLRAGYWFEKLGWLGIAFDASIFKPERRTIVAPLSGLLMLRYLLLPSEAAPDGELQPYVAAGPSVFVMSAKNSLNSTLPGSFAVASVEPGLDLRAGVAWQFHKNVAVYGEYRFTHVNAKFKDTTTNPSTSLDTNLNSNHFLIGVSYRF
jgi:opacity protein-like surface antigen